MNQPAISQPLVERHYAPNNERTTDNLSEVLELIPAERYDKMVGLVEIYAQPTVGRGLGTVHDETTYYTFDGNNVFMPFGVVQVGTAKTADNTEGFRMTRLFARNGIEMGGLETEIGLR